MSRTTSYAIGSELSISVIARAIARRSPARTAAASVSAVQSRRALTGATLSGGGFDHRRRRRVVGEQPAAEAVRDQRGACEQYRAAAPDPAGADLVGQRPGDDHRHAEAE